MKILTRKRTVGFLLALVTVLMLTCQAAAASATVSIDAPESLPAVGQTFTVKVSIADNPGLCAAQYTLSFDKSVVRCDKLKLGKILSGMLSAVNANADKGAIVACASTTAGSGDGVLSEYTFTVLKSGDPAFALVDGVFSDASGKSIDTNVTKPSYTEPEQKQDSSGGTSSGGSSSGSASGKKTQSAETVELYEKPTFSDVPVGFWGYTYIEKAAAKKLIVGNPDGTFLPGSDMTRAEFVTVLYRLAGSPAVTETSGFADVPEDAWYAKAVSWAAKNGYVTGDGTNFNPAGKITREQVVAILYRYDGGADAIESLVMSYSDPLDGYTDRDSVSSWAKSAMRWALYNGIISGTSETTLTPAGTALRAQVAAFFVRYIEK